ncbi:major facilitator superfamily domain-containing protein [Collybia nuda]|uniref:Major facilitator superfamily domain-containing protein n=1 Tax=Collybia nuda TaxID=64659 RepID=A0A9P6CC03_9AGAR|nr:major facilitator superfamily domain-containing protein [Collybia nuda]
MNGSPTFDRPYSAFTKKEKWFIVSLISLGGIFSPLTANIYFPAIPTISRVFHKSIELINLTVTMYMIMQGIAPIVWGPASDHLGRRPTFSGCLLILSLSCIGLALVPVSAYWLLMVLRCLQAAGSASTIAIGAGVIGDISTPRERGGFFGIYTLGPMIGPAIGPVIGGGLAHGLGWRAIFWFLCISSSLCLLVMVLFLPETLRTIVGDGSTVPSLIYRPVIPIIRPKGNLPETQELPKPSLPWNPFRLLIHFDIIILLGLNAIICAVFYGFTATTSTLFEATYPFLNETTIGLCFLAIGGGMAIGSVVNGRFLDWEYRRITRTRERPEKGGMTMGTMSCDDSFPIEKARLGAFPVLIVLLIVCSAGYGWCLVKRVNIAVPLVIQIVVGYLSIAMMNSTQTLMIDLMPGQGSSITACNNFVRCSLSAALVSVIQLIIDAVGVGWTYVILSGLSLFALPLLYLEMKVGPKCRGKRQSSG